MKKKNKRSDSESENQEELAVINRKSIERAAAAMQALDDNEHEFIEEETSEVSEDLLIWSEGDAETETEMEFEAEAETEVETSEAETSVEGTELAEFESAEIENVEILTDEQALSIIESVLFATDRPVSLAALRQIFRGTNIRSKEIRKCLADFGAELGKIERGVSLEEVGAGYQLRTKLDNVRFIKQSVKARPFKLSGQALEVLSIVAYKQPVTKAQIDEIRGVESGHLLRALMEKSLCGFGEKSELPGKPMFYETTKKFLEIFGLRNIHELPSLQEIDDLIPEGIGETEKQETLGELTDQLSQETAESYSQGEDELLKITDELSQITTTSEFFEKEKQRMRDKRDQDRAQNIREAIALGEAVDEKELKWLARYDEAQILQAQGAAEVAFVTEETSEAEAPEVIPTDEPLEPI